MNRLLLALILIGSLAVSGSVSAETKSTAKPSTKATSAQKATKTATQATEKAASDIQTFESKECGFTVKLPGNLKEPALQTKTIKSAAGDIPLLAYSTSGPHYAFVMSYNANPNNLTTDDAIQSALEAAKGGYVKSTGSKEVKSEKIQVQGFPGMMFEGIVDKDPTKMMYSRFLAVYVKPNRFYQFGFVTAKKDDLSETWVQRFFDDISINESLPEAVQ